MWFLNNLVCTRYQENVERYMKWYDEEEGKVSTFKHICNILTYLHDTGWLARGIYDKEFTGLNIWYKWIYSLYQKDLLLTEFTIVILFTSLPFENHSDVDNYLEADWVKDFTLSMLIG
jgi:hypothetical protein